MPQILSARNPIPYDFLYEPVIPYFATRAEMPAVAGGKEDRAVSVADKIPKDFSPFLPGHERMTRLIIVNKS